MEASNPPSGTFPFSVQGVTHDLQVLSFKGQEAISEPFCFEIELVSEYRNLALDQYLHKLAFLQLDADGHGIHGQIHAMGRSRAGRRLTHYHVTLVPRLYYLTHRHNSRVFQHQSVQHIIARVLEEHGILGDAVAFKLGPTPQPVLEYCTQHDESDLYFIQRLCEQAGFHYHFQHTPDNHLLVFGEDQTVFPRLAPVAFHEASGMTADGPVINQLSVRLATRINATARRDYDFTQPSVLMESTFTGDAPQALAAQPSLEDYRHPAGFSHRDHGRRLAKRALEQQRSDATLATGESDVSRLCSGHFMPLIDHDIADWNDLWLLTRITHQGKAPQVLEESCTVTQQGFSHGYRNQFSATPWTAIYRPPAHHPRRPVQGSQSATVTGPPGEEIWCDEFGRVKVRLHWNRDNIDDEHSSCWLRVISGWAGDRYGALTIPRVGTEVVVNFFDGDGDRPYIAGSLFRRGNEVPYPLPAHKTRSVFKTLSSPGGGGGNELRLEDRQGAEHIYVHAQRDWECRVRNDQTTDVGGQRHDRVSGDSFSLMQGQEHRTTQGDRNTSIFASDYLDIGQNLHVHTALGQFHEAGQHIHIKAGQRVTIDAGVELTLNAGGKTLKLDPAGIWYSETPQIGASASPATNAQRVTAQLPGAATDAAPGAVSLSPLASVQLTLMQNAATQGLSRCPVCEACLEAAKTPQLSAGNRAP